jgi:hypothetical protein
LISRPVNAAPVNCELWSVLKISELPCLASASFNVSTQKAACIMIDTRDDRTRWVRMIRVSPPIAALPHDRRSQARKFELASRILSAAAAGGRDPIRLQAAALATVRDGE